MSQAEQKKIGAFVKHLREQKSMTQAEFAQALKTSQSAIARMEKGEQNFTTDTLQKIGNVLNRSIVSLHESIDFKVTGGKKLSGSIETNTSKNGALGLLCASLINKGKTTLHGIPKIEEVHRLIEIFTSIGVSAHWTDNNSVTIVPPKTYRFDNIDAEAASKIRSVLMLMGPLAGRIPEFLIPHAGGCKMGARTVQAHALALEKMGIAVTTESFAYRISVPKKKRLADIVMYEASDTATENALMAAATIPGETVIRFAPPNYQVQDVCFFLEKLGVQIDGIGTTTMTVCGVEDIDCDIEHWNSEDPIESMMFLSAAIVTESELTIKRCPIDFLRLELYKLENMGLKYDISPEYVSNNGRTKLVDITTYPSKLRALPDKIHAQPYPGINNDNLPFFVPIATQAEGSTLIHDWTWENRAIYFTELNRLGANITLMDPHRALIVGPTKLKAAQVVCPPALRPAVIVLIAMMGANGVSVLRNVYSIKRGYEEIADRLNAIGADIQVLKEM